MPNWKSYEATVRLLSAIVAAHPNLKLDYAAISKYYGDESTYHQIWHGMNGIKRKAESLRNAVDAGLNASTVDLENDSIAKKEISVRFGGDCTASAVENRFRRLKSDAKLINAAVAKGEDPILMNVGDTNGGVACKGKAISELMGSATPASHIKSQLRETIKPLSERLIAMRDADEDCKDVDLTDLGSRRYKAETARIMGSDTTASSLKNHFHRTVKVLGNRQMLMLAAGRDSKDVSLDKLGLKIVAIMGSDVTIEAIKQQIGKRIKVLGSRQTEMRAAGHDPKNVDLEDLAAPKKDKGEMDKLMGDSTANGLRFQFDTRYKIIAKRQKAMLAAGKNPSTVDIVTGGKTEVQKCFGSDASTGGIKFQFATSIKRNVDQIRSARAAGKDCKDITFNSNGLLIHTFHCAHWNTCTFPSTP
ncbi:hypothetical protein BcDW1_8378 [Botrytis cinerea BcDW1]|uniref:Uncharacterized protein n=1 Tax=Botryotinia fuckeliana (strain BcDW1) TaxID=1290391 RepID=M7THR1_BOTF1|nr:hypothetical protein BcDW1_8378 [Botrytis cinerea BcDW1]